MIFEVTLTYGWLQFFPLVVMQRDTRVCQRQLSYLCTQVGYVKFQHKNDKSLFKKAWSGSRDPL